MSAHPSRVRNARPRDRRQLNVVRGRKRGLLRRSGSRRVAPVVVIGAILVAGTIFTVLLEQVVLAQTGFKTAQLREDMVKAESEHAKLVLRAARLSSSERIEKVAMDQLGMVQPKPEQIRYVVANVKVRQDQYLAYEQLPEPLDEGAAAAAELGGISP